ncbi:MAG: hypothetical protein ACJ8GW_19405 [Massilia sp.]
MRQLLSAIIAASLMATTGSAFAAAECIETITHVILHENGNIYFNTDKTCSQTWCQLNWNAAANKNAYALLLTAQTTGRTVRLYWANLASCNDLQPTYASPNYMTLN